MEKGETGDLNQVFLFLKEGIFSGRIFFFFKKLTNVNTHTKGFGVDVRVHSVDSPPRLSSPS